MRRTTRAVAGALAVLLVAIPFARAAAQGAKQGVTPAVPPPAAAAQAAAQAAAGASAATDSVLDARTAEVAAGLRCPVCQGESIQDSPSELSQQMRALVKEQLAAGKTPDEVRAYFASKYGEWILLAPKARGFNLLVYVLPPFLLLAGFAGIVLLVRRWTAAGSTTANVEGGEPPPED